MYFQQVEAKRSQLRVNLNMSTYTCTAPYPVEVHHRRLRVVAAQLICFNVVNLRFKDEVEDVPRQRHYTRSVRCHHNLPRRHRDVLDCEVLRARVACYAALKVFYFSSSQINFHCIFFCYFWREKTQKLKTPATLTLHTPPYPPQPLPPPPTHHLVLMIMVLGGAMIEK